MKEAFTVAQILNWVDGRVANHSAVGLALEDVKVVEASPLGSAQPHQIAYFFSKSYQRELLTADPGILVTGEDFVAPLQAAGLPIWKNRVIIACKDPYLAMAVLSRKFAEFHFASHLHDPAPLVHSSAVIHPSAIIGKNVHISAHVVIEENAKIGEGSYLYPGCYVGARSIVGNRCILFSHVVLYEGTELGDEVRIHANSVIGADGFGYAPKREGKRIVGHEKIFHFGKVVVGDEVEIGASSSIDRGTFGETRIGKYVKIDNQVQIGHNVTLDEGAIICGGTAMGGSASVGKYAYIGGNCGISNQVHVGDGAQVAAHTLVSKDVPNGTTVAGTPQRESREHFKVHALLNKLLMERKNST